MNISKSFLIGLFQYNCELEDRYEYPICAFNSQFDSFYIL